MASSKKSASNARSSSSRSRKVAKSYEKLPDAFDVQVVRLVECNFEQSPVPDDLDSESFEYYYDFDTYFSIGSDGNFYGVSTCALEKKYEGKACASVSAKYAFGLAQKEGGMEKYDSYELSKYVSQSVVWPMFRSYVSVIKSQSNVKMPSLPYIVPVNVSHQRDL